MTFAFLFRKMREYGIRWYLWKKDGKDLTDETRAYKKRPGEYELEDSEAYAGLGIEIPLPEECVKRNQHPKKECEVKHVPKTMVIY